MKICPKCGTKYTNEELQFCLEDRTPLAHDGPPTEALEDEQPTQFK